MIIVGLTGSIGTGKSFVTRQFAHLGAATLDSDLVVHALLGPGGKAVQKVARLFPQTLEKARIDRKALGAEVFGHPEKLKALEAIIHPLVFEAQRALIRKSRKEGRRIVVLDIPLLFETQGERRCDAVVVTSAPAFLQRRRVSSRPNMTPEKFKRILAAQMPDFEKRKRADFTVMTGLGRAASLAQVKRILLRLLRKNDLNHL